MNVNRRGFLGRVGKLGAAGAAIAAVGLPVLESDPPPALVGEAGPTLVSLPELGPTFQEIRAMVPEADLSDEQISYLRFGLQQFGTVNVYFKGYAEQLLAAGAREVAGLEPLPTRLMMWSQELNWDGTTLTKGLLK